MLVSDCWDALKNRRQGKEETVMKYFQEKVRLCRELSLGFSETRDYVLRGLNEWELVQYALRKEHKDEDELLHDLLEWTRMYAVRGERTKYAKPLKDTKREHGSWKGKPVSKPSDVGVEAVTAVDGVGKTSEHTLTCWKCHKEGHVSRDCPVGRKGGLKCFTCHGEGHFSRHCPERRTANSVTEQKEIGTHPYEKRGVINGQNIKVLIDTGSHYSLIKTSVAVKCGLPIIEDTNSLYGLGDMNNPSVTTSGQIVSTIIIDEVEAGPVQLLVVPDDALRPDIIVGRNWLDDPAVVYWKEEGQMKLAKSSDQPGIGDITATKVSEHLDVLPVIALDSKTVRRVLSCEDFKSVNTEVILDEQRKLMNLVNEYRDCFALNIEELGCTGLTAMELREIEGSTPVVCRPYKTTAADREAIAEIVQEWKKHGVVVETESPYASPVILVKQGDKNRLCVDYRQLNKQLKEVLVRLRFANLTLKPAKCSLGVKYVEFLGFVIGEGTICPGEVKTKAVQEFPVPGDVHTIRRFLGLTGFFRRFVANYATVALPLTNLTKTGTAFVWGGAQQEAFDQLKDSLVSKPVMTMYNQNAFSTEVHTDASSVGIGAMLLQREKDGDAPKLVYCISKKLSEAESRYHSGKLELMAVVWAVNKWRNFLLGIKFTIYTDCQALIYLRAHRALRPQIARWHDLLQEYEYDIQHRPGTKMSHVDALSRAPVTESDGTTLDDVLAERLTVCVTLDQVERVLMAQTADGDINDIMKILKKPEAERTKLEKDHTKGYELQGQSLYRWYEGKKLFVMPRSMRKSITVGAHDLCGHLSVEKTVSQILQDYWFPKMRRYVRRHVRMCIECLMTKRPRGRQPGLLHPIPVGRRPFDIVHMDHIGPFLTTPAGNKYILVTVDNFTKFTCIFAAKDTGTEGVLESMSSIVQMFGLPNRLVTDRGTCFTSRKFEEFCDEQGIQHTLTSTRRPQANGQVERVNSVVISMLLTQVTKEDEWDQWLTTVQRQINNSESKVTRRTPFELLHGYQPRFTMGKTRGLSGTADTWCCPEELWEEAREALENSKGKMKADYDQHRHDNTKYTIGEIVVMTTLPSHTGQSTKLQNKYRGPLIIVEVLPSDVYRVAQLQEDQKRMFTTTAHVSQLKSWKLEGELGETKDHSEGEDQETSEVIKVDDSGAGRPVRVRRKPLKLQDYV